MKTIKNLIGSGIILSLFLLAACSKKSDSPAISHDYKSPTLAKDTLIKIPDAMKDKAENGDDFNLTLAVSQIELVNGLTTGLSTAFFYDQTTIDGWNATKNSDGSISYDWKYLAYTIKLTYYTSSSETWWKYEEDSASYKYPIYYISDKGTSGETDWYSQTYFKSPQRLAYKDNWTKSESGTYNSTFNWYENDGTTISTQYKSVSNADKSGTLKIYELNNSNVLVLQWAYTWDKTGAGTYTYYDSDGTTVINSGSF